MGVKSHGYLIIISRPTNNGKNQYEVKHHVQESRRNTQKDNRNAEKH